MQIVKFVMYFHIYFKQCGIFLTCPNIIYWLFYIRFIQHQVCSYLQLKCTYFDIQNHAFKGVLHPRPILRLFVYFSQKLQQIGDK